MFRFKSDLGNDLFAVLVGFSCFAMGWVAHNPLPQQHAAIVQHQETPEQKRNIEDYEYNQEQQHVHDENGNHLTARHRDLEQEELNNPSNRLTAHPQEARSGHWPVVRKEHLEKHPTCAACGGKTNLQVHHLTPFHSKPELELDPNNLITLCEAPNRLCHLRIGHAWDFKSYNPNAKRDAARELEMMKERKPNAPE